MATETLTTAQNALKRVYPVAMTNQLALDSVLYARTKKTADGIVAEGEGLYAYVPAHTAHPNVGWRSEGGTLPSATADSYSQMRVGLAYLYGPFNISGQLLKAAKSNRGSFMRAMDEKMKRIGEAMALELNRAFWGDGSGALAQITQASGSITAGNTITVDNAAQLVPQMRIDTFSAKSGGSSGLDSVVIDQVDYNNNTITLTTTQTVTQNFFIFREDSRGKYAQGLLGIVDGADSDGNRVVSSIQNITRSSNLWADANVLDNAGSVGTNRAITVKLVQQACERGERNIGKSPTVIYSSFGVRDSWFDLLQADKRYVNVKMLDGGFSAMEYSGGKAPIPWIVDRMCPVNTAFFVHEPELSIYQATNGVEWVDEDGAILSRGSDDSYDARSRCYITLASHQFQCHTVLRDITE